MLEDWSTFSNCTTSFAEKKHRMKFWVYERVPKSNYLLLVLNWKIFHLTPWEYGRTLLWERTLKRKSMYNSYKLVLSASDNYLSENSSFAQVQSIPSLTRYGVNSLHLQPILQWKYFLLSWRLMILEVVLWSFTWWLQTHQTDSPVHNVSPVMVVNSVGKGWRMWCMSFLLLF